MELFEIKKDMEKEVEKTLQSISKTLEDKIKPIKVGKDQFGRIGIFNGGKTVSDNAILDINITANTSVKLLDCYIYERYKERLNEKTVNLILEKLDDIGEKYNAFVKKYNPYNGVNVSNFTS